LAHGPCWRRHPKIGSIRPAHPLPRPRGLSRGRGYLGIDLILFDTDVIRARCGDVAAGWCREDQWKRFVDEHIDHNDRTLQPHEHDLGSRHDGSANDRAAPGRGRWVRGWSRHGSG
jgi:hypothetical protein